MYISIDELEKYIDMILTGCKDCNFYKTNSCYKDISEFKYPEICSTISTENILNLNK